MISEDPVSYVSYIKESWFVGIKNRLLQEIARKVPGAMTLRPLLHRWRGVKIEKNVWIGYDAIIETAHPELVTIKGGAIVSIQALILAHFGGWERRVIIEKNAFLGPRVIVLPNVVIGEGSVVAAGSVVTQSVPPMTLVQGNPAKAVAQADEAM
jgi:acetyltransferase-like isoleucine patch superfamily enzyme